ncbi:MAG TPA: hypothetical protein VEO56_00465 [Bacteroidota bacterium]|nr:hypothetical protein [Bacteroidota bacterium]
MIFRAVVVWIVVLVCAFLNGGLRVAFIIPSVGESAGHVISCFTLSLLILLATFLFIRWMHPENSAEAIRVGVLWLILTLMFEFLACHYLFGNSWEKILSEYNLLRGRIWVLVLIVTTFSPLIMARVRGMFGAATN